MKITKISLFLTLILSTTSCVYLPQEVKLSPEIQSSSSNLGKNSSVDVIVTDKRDDKTVIGRRGNGMASIAPINNNQDLEQLLKNVVVDSLTKKKFIIPSKNGKVLDISLLSLKYQSLFGFFTIGSKIDVALDVKILDQNNSVIYNNIYRSNLEKRHAIFAPLASTNEKNINLSFQNAINSMLNDDLLVQFLK